LIRFTDKGWSNGVFRAFEGVIDYRATRTIYAGMVERLDDTSTNGLYGSYSGTALAFSDLGDQVIAYQSFAGSTTCLAAAQISQAGWQPLDALG
jgi:hypothetical protein